MLNLFQFRKLFNRTFLQKVATVLFLVASSVLFALFLEYRARGNIVSNLQEFVLSTPSAIFFSSVFFFFVLVILSILTRRTILSFAIVMATTIGIAYASSAKHIARGVPILPEDFNMVSETGSLLQFIDFFELGRNILAIILVLTVAIYFEKIAGKYLRIFNSKNRTNLILSFIFVIFSIFGIKAMIDSTHSNGIAKDLLKNLNLHTVAWNQNANYHFNGFVLGFMYNLKSVELPKPDGYDKNKMAEIIKTYQNLKNQDANRLPLKDLNIVMVLNESFYDPSILKDHISITGPNPTSTLDKIKKTSPSGHMFSSVYGGGTANVEFEVTSGLSNFWTKSTPYQDILPKIGEIKTFARFAKNKGFKTTAVHSFSGEMYKRNTALKNEGFDTFIDEGKMTFRKKEGKGMIKDSEIYKEALKILKADNSDKFLKVITMQNHMPYHDGIYDNIEYSVSGNFADDDEKRRASIYLQLLKNSDKYLGEWLDELSKLDKNTVVLFYGDHSPGIFSKISDNDSPKIRHLAYQPPYFIWANFNLPKAKDMKNLPTNSPNCLGNTLFNALNVEKPLIGYVLDGVCKDEPILTRIFLKDDYKNHTKTLSDYQMINYDTTHGQKIWNSYKE